MDCLAGFLDLLLEGLLRFHERGYGCFGVAYLLVYLLDRVQIRKRQLSYQLVSVLVVVITHTDVTLY